MLIKDLESAATLDRETMHSVRGGFSKDRFSFMETMKYSFLESNSLQAVETMQGNTLAQSAGVASMVGGKGSFAGIDGGANDTYQSNTAINVN